MVNKAPTTWSEALGDERAADELWAALDATVALDESSVVDDSAVDAAWLRLAASLDAPPMIVEPAAASVAKVVRLSEAAARLSPKRKTTWRTWVSVAAAAIALLFLVNVFSGLGEITASFANTGSAPLKAVLPDRTTILLSPGSELSYEEADGLRSVYMRGRVGFAVRPNKDKPFAVTAEQLQIRVVGTKFIISEDGETEVTVTEGHVRLRGVREADWVDLLAGGSATVSEGVVINSTEKTLSAVDLRFRDALLSDVLSTLSDYHQVPLSAAPHLMSCRVTASFEDGSALEAMGTLKVIFGAALQERSTGIQLVGGACR